MVKRNHFTASTAGKNVRINNQGQQSVLRLVGHLMFVFGFVTKEEEIMQRERGMIKAYHMPNMAEAVSCYWHGCLSMEK